MTLKTDYLDGATGFTSQMADVFAAGETFVSTNYAAIQTALQEAASKGQKDFTLTLLTTFETTSLRLDGTHLST